MPGPVGPGTVWYPPYYSSCQLNIVDWGDTTGTGVRTFHGEGPAALTQEDGIPSYADQPLIDDTPYIGGLTYGRDPTVMVNMNASIGGGLVTYNTAAQHWGGLAGQSPLAVMNVMFMCRDYRAWDAFWPHKTNIDTIRVNVAGSGAPLSHHDGPPIGGTGPGPHPIGYSIFGPMSDLVAAIPDRVEDPDDWEWVNGTGGTIATPPIMPPMGGGVWGFPPRPFNTVTWTEVGRFPMVPGPEGTNPPGTPPPGPGWAYGGAWDITVNLDTDLRDGRLTIVFADDNFFSNNIGDYMFRQNPDIFTNDEYESASWGIYPIWSNAPKIATPPLRMRQRWIHGSSHAGGGRPHPVITQSRGDIG